MNTMPRQNAAAPSDDRPPDLIVQGGIVVTIAEGHAPIPGGCIRIRDGRILSVDADTALGPMETHCDILDARGGLVLPGLVNAHCHTAMTLFRGFADDLPLREWLYEHIFPAEARFLNPESVYWGSLLGCLEMIASGTTCFMDGYFFQDATVEAVERAGLRALLAQGVIDFPAPGVDRPEENLDVGRAFLERWSGVSDRITPGLFCHSPLTCSKQTLQNAMALSLEFGVPLQTHLSETSQEVDEIRERTGKHPVFYLDAIRVLSENLVAAHAIHLNREEVALLAERGVRVVHVPESNMKLASGKAPVQDMLDAGLCIGLGTDGCASNNDLDLFREMDVAAKLAKVTTDSPVSLNAPTVLNMATRGGAAVLGMEKEIGTLEVGKRADLIVLDLNRPHLQPLYNPCSTVVYSARGADVRHSVVDGRVLMRDRRFQTLDAEEIMKRVSEISRTVQ